MMRTIRAPVAPGSSLTLLSPGGTGKHPRDLQSIRRSPPHLSP